ncbi:sigma factor G inhibitor Gin [Gorillibacterium timonense]|uniref:sigma factor G inhibitor Gin n=1 Tax=Gorillibacterium timonense TaxID=1689269 RepID=UPI00071E12F0|nr:sigma factor G inhibitor Gin [Gorillibacterium timonense]
MEETNSECIICGETGKSGITIISGFICEACEAEMVRTDVLDEKYPFFIHRLKGIWFKKNA